MEYEGWKIGNEARLLDEMCITERMKIERSTVKKIGGALVVYGTAMGLMALFL
jgi:hypothetical protein